jgi:hypothetical protein
MVLQIFLKFSTKEIFVMNKKEKQQDVETDQL